MSETDDTKRRNALKRLREKRANGQGPQRQTLAPKAATAQGDGAAGGGGARAEKLRAFMAKRNQGGGGMGGGAGAGAKGEKLRAFMAQRNQGGAGGGGMGGGAGAGGGAGGGAKGEKLRAFMAQRNQGGAGGMAAGAAVTPADPAAQRKLLQERISKLQARLAELDASAGGVEDATIVEETKGKATKGNADSDD